MIINHIRDCAGRIHEVDALECSYVTVAKFYSIDKKKVSLWIGSEVTNFLPELLKSRP